MAKVKQDSRFWCCLVVCSVPVGGQTITSFLSFWADNRFKASKAIEAMLPDNPKWLNEEGNLHPYRILAFHQCKPDETQKYAQAYLEQFRMAVGLATEDSELETTVYH